MFITYKNLIIFVSMEMNAMETAMQPFATRVDHEVLKHFRMTVLRKHGKLYGKLKDEIETALSEHIIRMEAEMA